jgi:photosystem II stability/assembly factor-like uncharacterized protein
MKDLGTIGGAANAPLMAPLGSIRRAALSALPLAIVAGLMYAAFFIKPQVHGASTMRPVIEKRDRFYGVTNPAEDVVWAAGNHGKIVRSEDYGKSWTAQGSGTAQHLQTIAAWDERRAVAAGNSGTVVVTADAGNTWRTAELPAQAAERKLIRVRTYADGSAWVVGELGTVLVAEEFGVRWKDVSGGGDVTWNDVGAFGSGACIVGEFGRIRCSRDGYRSWADEPSPVKSSLTAVAFRNETDGMAVGLEGVIVVTNDAGRHWQVLPRTTEQHLYDVLWDGARWLAVGDKGVTLVGNTAAQQWQEVKSGESSASWHTQVVGRDGRYVSVGQGVSFVTLKTDWAGAEEKDK